jgi:predicted ester cyclase
MSTTAAFRRVIDEIWNHKADGAIEKHISPDYVGRNPDGDRTGVDGFRDLHATYTTAFPDCSIELGHGVGEGDTAVFHYVFRGTHTGELMGIAPSGNSVEVHGIGMSRFDNGKVVEDRTVWDSLSLMKQIGAA